MSVSIDKEPADDGDARRVLASWLDDYAGGRCDRADMQESFLSVCRSNPDAPWDALALLDQYQRRGKIDAALARTLKADIAQLVFGNANQTGTPPRDSTEATLDTSGSRWRKLVAENDPHTADVEPSFVDPTLFRRDFDPATRPPPVTLERRGEERRDPEPREEQQDEAPPLRQPQARELPSFRAKEASPKDVLRDRYELISILGRGSAGTVYKALDRHKTHLGAASRYVAVKVLKLDYQSRPEALATLEREFHQAQSLSHPNVVSVFDLDRDGDTYFIVMELLEGQLLADIQQRLRGPMQRQHALALISSVGAALAHAHRREVVHADLKPRNIMITSTGEVRVLDFGFARHRPLDLHSAPTFDAPPASAPAYASVERVTGSEPHPSDDVYSLACIAYELLAGEHPFGGRSAVLARANGRRPRAIAGLTRKQMQALNRALLWGRGERKIDVVDLLAGLGCAEAPNKLVPPEELVAYDGRGQWRRRLLGLLVFLLLFGAAAAAFVYLERHPLPVRPAEAPASPPPAASDNNEAPAVENNEPAAAASPPPAAAQQPETSVVKAPSQAKNPPKAAPEPRSAPAKTASTTAARPAAAASTGPVTIEFDKDTYVTTESDGSVRIVVERHGSKDRPVSFRWNLRSNSAEQGTDFAGIGPGTETIPAGASTATLTIPLVSDAIVENTEVFLVEIEPVESGVRLGERSHAAVIIVDDD
ncbi:MAG TPA: protein kinase [Steroidobacteraceae bacterium]|nr:protein kinase [Steroidobacteraceae bacterium]